MTNGPSDDDLDRLLARGRLGGPERDRILERVLDESAPTSSEARNAPVLPARAPTPRARHRRWLYRASFGVAGVAAAAAALILVLRREPEDRFGAKGGGGTQAPRLEVACADGDSARCAIGSTLVFRVEGAEAGGVLAAFAVREGAPEDARIWYFPSRDGADGGAPEVAADARLQVVPRGVRIGPEHAPGRYTVHLALGTRALTRAEVLDPAGRDVVARATASIEVTP